MKALDARPGSRIADVGAGDGFYTLRIARAVLPDGRAVAEDIDAAALTKLRERVKTDGLTNVDVLTGSVDDPGLASGSFDAVLVHNAYHEFVEHEKMLDRILHALKPGGRFVLIEPFHESSKGLSREEQTKTHNLSADLGEQELRTAGFEIVARDNEFVKFAPVAPGAFWMIVARRPSTCESRVSGAPFVDVDAPGEGPGAAHTPEAVRLQGLVHRAGRVHKRAEIVL